MDPWDMCTETLPIERKANQNPQNPWPPSTYTITTKIWPSFSSTFTSKAIWSLFSYTTDFFVDKPSHQPAVTWSLCRTSHSSGILELGLDNMNTNAQHRLQETSALVHDTGNSEHTFMPAVCTACEQHKRCWMPDNSAAEAKPRFPLLILQSETGEKNKGR